MKPEVPAASTQEYLWWSQGARDESECRDEGLSYEVRDMRHALESLAKLNAGNTAKLAADLAYIYCPKLPLRRRVALAWSLLRG